jgi:hypothetical protein
LFKPVARRVVTMAGLVAHEALEAITNELRAEIARNQVASSLS